MAKRKAAPAATKTKDAAPQPELAQEAPSTKGKALATWEAFQSEIQERAHEIQTMLPSNVPKDRYINSVIAAVKQDPKILLATPRSLMAAIIKSAQDGLLPDGREGHIAVYETTIKGTNNKEMVAQWNPMVAGLRKRARELDGIIIDAQVVYLNDKFRWEQGDDPIIEHIPAGLHKDRGHSIGVYAIFKRENGVILHREVMDKVAVQDTRDQSKAKDSLMWTKFWTEGWRKSVIRRGIKTVPVSAALTTIMQRIDDDFDFADPAPADAKRVPPPRPTRGKNAFNRKPDDITDAEEIVQDDRPEAPDLPDPRLEGDADGPGVKETPVQRCERLLPTCATTNDVADLRATILEEVKGKDEVAVNAMCDARSKALTSHKSVKS